MHEDHTAIWEHMDQAQQAFLSDSGHAATIQIVTVSELVLRIPTKQKHLEMPEQATATLNSGHNFAFYQNKISFPYHLLLYPIL